MTDATLKTIITADASKFKAAVAGAQSTAKSFDVAVGKHMNSISVAFAAAGVAATLASKAIFGAADRIGDLKDAAEQVGVTTQSLQNMAAAAALTGVSMQDMTGAVTKMNKNVAETILTGEGASKAFAAIGLSAQQLRSMAPEDQFALIAERIKNIGDVQLQTKVGMDIFGKSSAAMLSLFNGGLKESTAEAEKLGLTLSSGQVDALDKLSDTKDKLSSVWDGFVAKTAAKAAPALQGVLDQVFKLIDGMGGVEKVSQRMAGSITESMKSVKKLIEGGQEGASIAKDAYSAVSSSFVGDVAKFALSVAQAPFVFGAKALIGKDGSGATYGTAPTPLKYTPPSTDISDAAQALARQRVIDAYADQEKAIKRQKDATDLVVNSLKEMKSKALDVAGVFDRFGAIKNALGAQGNKQSQSIIEAATSQQGAISQLAPDDKFKDIFNKALVGAKSGTGNPQESIQALEQIIKDSKEGFLRFDEALGNYRSDAFDTSGLTSALNELKSFLGTKPNTQQEVKVNIKVDAGKDFVTTVTTDLSFREAVSKEFDEKIAQAARGTAP